MSPIFQIARLLLKDKNTWEVWVRQNLGKHAWTGPHRALISKFYWIEHFIVSKRSYEQLSSPIHPTCPGITIFIDEMNYLKKKLVFSNNIKKYYQLEYSIKSHHIHPRDSCVGCEFYAKLYFIHCNSQARRKNNPGSIFRIASGDEHRSQLL